MSAQHDVFAASTARDACDNAEGWRARLDLEFQFRASRTTLVGRKHHGPLRIQRPFYPGDGACHTYVIHPPGGVVGGDHLHVNCRMKARCNVLVTTPGAGKFYRSTGQRARQTQHLHIGAHGCLQWLPQENIFFSGAKASLDTQVCLHGSAKLVLWEIHCFGRPVAGERFDSGDIDSALQIFRDGHPLFIERLRMSRDTAGCLSLMANQSVIGTLAFTGANDMSLNLARNVIDASATDQGTATLLDDLLLVRFLGASTAHARRLFERVWCTVGPCTTGFNTAVPRIWAT